MSNAKDSQMLKIFIGINSDQKKSFSNFLLLLATCNPQNGEMLNRQEFACNYRRIFNISTEECLSYMEKYGLPKMIEDLKLLSQSQKDCLIVAAWDTITAFNKPSNLETQFMREILMDIGITTDKFASIIRSYHSVLKQSMG